MTAATPSPVRLYTLDALRGIAALCVVFWHWQHFFYVGSDPSGLVVSQQPFYQWLTPLYHHGGMAVQLFFTISGFVFFWLFSRGIADRSIRPTAFAWDRFSRLYPLHIVTFALVAGLQLMYADDHDSYFVYAFNDVYHAVLNLFLAPAWGLEKGWSFNAPVWSVSVEVLLYGSFFLVCLAGRWRWVLAVGGCGLGAWLYPESYKIGSGLLCFYIGGITYGLVECLRRQVGDRVCVAITTVACLGAWGCLVYGMDVAMDNLLIGLCFPLTLAMLAAAGHCWPNLMRSCAWLGDISYSSYLLHFPLQIVFAMAVDGMGLSRSIFYHGWTMLLFFAVLVPISMLGHRMLERPAQRFLRQRMGEDVGVSRRSERSAIG
ncbi:acyltransferase [Pseudomonas capeferrum]|uniref:acyltransferase family protein n=1 Tax=Pseudomonas capeferrum TaxID=1495066 RepID=UPI0015E427FD|nr:acyltransferase [Pseudomonas capeferrum]MBA1204472.1 acyltransferase [Pseudomonas capeferrum]